MSHIKAACGLALITTVIVTALPAEEAVDTRTMPVSLSIQESDTQPEVQVLVPEPEIVDTAAAPAESSWKQVKIRRGDNLALIFKRMKIPASELQAVLSLGDDVKVLRKIMPGHELSFQVNETNLLTGLRYQVSSLVTLEVISTANALTATMHYMEPEVLYSFATAEITTKNPSLYHAGKAAGLSDAVIMKLSYIFQWDISFALDMRKGDTFSILYEEVFVEGEKVKDGEILAASFNNMGDEHVAVQYAGNNGRTDYYTPEGMSLRKAFLRDPVHFSHVSSRFNMRRLHPIHKKVMPHRGIDYAARKGTPVVAAGDGKVSIARQNSASGKYVVVQHGEQYTTKYLHLSAFGKGIRPGKTVKQGQTIGYVGATGWATAAHLHYEFLVNGVHKNPRTVALPKASPVAVAEKGRFQVITAPMLTRLASLSGKTSYALADEIPAFE